MSSQQTAAFIATVRTLVAEEAFDATPEEIRDVFLEAFGSELTEEQLAAIAGGLEDYQIMNYAVTGTLTVAVLAVGAAGAAA